MQKIGNNHVKRVHDLIIGDVFKMNSTDCWKQVRKIDNVKIYYSPVVMVTKERKGTRKLETIGCNSSQWVHLQVPKQHDIFFIKTMMRPDAIYTNISAMGIASSYVGLNISAN